MYLQRTFRWRDSAFPKAEVHHSRLQEQHHTKSQYLVQGPMTNGHTWVLNPGPLTLSPVSLHQSTFPYLTSPLRCLLALNPFNRSKSKTPWKAPRLLSLKAGWPDIMCSCYDAIWGQSTPVKCSCQKGWSDSNQPVRTHIHFKEIWGREAEFKSHHKETIRHFQGWGTLQDNGCYSTRGVGKKKEENWLRLERLGEKMQRAYAMSRPCLHPSVNLPTTLREIWKFGGIWISAGY